jgi:hypothetical protein
MSLKGLCLAFALFLSAAPAWSIGREAAVEPAALHNTPVLPSPTPALAPVFSLTTPAIPDALSQPALGTPGVYSNAFHQDIVNPRIKNDIESGRFVRLSVQDGGLQISDSGSLVPENLLQRVSRRAKALVDLASFDGGQLILVSAAPGTPEFLHPHLLAVTKDDYQVAHAGTHRDEKGKPQGRYGYMTAELFAEERLSPQSLLGVIKEELGHAQERSAAIEKRRRPPVEAFGAAHISALESLLDIVREDLSQGRPSATTILPSGPLTRFWRWLFNRSPAPQIPWSFKLVNGHYYYHGTTLFDLLRIVDAGGVMAPEVSQFSMLANDSVGYAYSRQYNLNRPDNPVVLLQFKNETIAELVSSESFRPAAALIDRGVPPNHQSYAIAVKPVPLSLMTRQSKDSVLGWLRLQIVRYPEQSKWAELLPKIKKALDP